MPRTASASPRSSSSSAAAKCSIRQLGNACRPSSPSSSAEQLQVGRASVLHSQHVARKSWPHAPPQGPLRGHRYHRKAICQATSARPSVVFFPTNLFGMSETNSTDMYARFTNSAALQRGMQHQATWQRLPTHTLNDVKFCLDLTGKQSSNHICTTACATSTCLKERHSPLTPSGKAATTAS